jgi:hypothetical protein
MRQIGKLFNAPPFLGSRGDFVVRGFRPSFAAPQHQRPHHALDHRSPMTV